MCDDPGLRRRAAQVRVRAAWALAATAVGWLVLTGAPGCTRKSAALSEHTPSKGGAGRRSAARLTAAKPIEPRGLRERLALERGPDLEFVDRLMDERTRVPDFDRRPLAELAPDALITDRVAILDDTEPFREKVPIPPKEVTINVSIARSTYRARTEQEVLSAVQPFIDLVQREVNVRGAPVLHDSAEDVYFGLLDGAEQMAIAHVFDYLLIRSWFESVEGNATVLLASAQPANPRTTALDRGFRGTPGTSIELVVAADAPYQTFADLKNARLALAANYVDAPGTFLTRLLADIDHPPDRPFFGKVTLRRYPKDAVIDVIKGKADVACIDQGTVGALDRFYGLATRLRTLAISPRYNVDVLFTSTNNVETHRTEIELTQTQLTTLGKDPEGQEVLFFFDTQGWYNYREGDIQVPRENYADFLAFIDNTPVDLRPLLDPDAPVDRQTYDRYGDE